MNEESVGSMRVYASGMIQQANRCCPHPAFFMHHRPVHQCSSCGFKIAETASGGSSTFFFFPLPFPSSTSPPLDHCRFCLFLNCKFLHRKRTILKGMVNVWVFSSRTTSEAREEKPLAPFTLFCSTSALVVKRSSRVCSCSHVHRS
jgi:hypothetical protein